MKKVFGYYRRYSHLIILALLFLTLEAICELQLPSYMSSLVTEGIGQSDIDTIWSYGGKMIAITVTACVCSVIVGFFASKVSARLSRDLRSDMFGKVMAFANEEYNKFAVSSLITRCTNDITQIQLLTFMFLRMIMFAPIMGIGGTIRAIEFSSGISALAFVIIGALLVVVALIIIALTIVQPKYIKMQKQIDKVNQIAGDELSGMLVIRAFNTQNYEENRFDIANKDLTRISLFTTRLMAILMPVMTIVMNGMSVAIVWIYAYNVESIEQISNMMAFIQYSFHIIMSFMMISMIFILLPRAMVSVKRVGEVLGMEVSIKNADDAKTPTGQRFKGDIKFDNVSYCYGGDNPAIEGITFKAKSGEVTALIGSTGSGKSTIINLIPRLMDVSSGSITIDGKNVKDINLKDLRNNIGFVPQKNILFSGTIASNIGYGQESLEQNIIAKSAEIAQAKDFIESSEEGYDREIAQGGSNVSGGQKQRIAIARALAKNAPINIFDDSFSALDFKTDAKLRMALSKEMSDSTVIIVAQRVGTIKNADKIIVLDEGKIVGIGKHEELLKNCATYLDIAKSQLSEEELGL